MTFEEWSEAKAGSVVHRWFETTEDGLLNEIVRALLEARRAGQEPLLTAARDALRCLEDDIEAAAREILKAVLESSLPLERDGCETCGGSGSVTVEIAQAGDQTLVEDHPCPDCTLPLEGDDE